jgi:protein gp37
VGENTLISWAKGHPGSKGHTFNLWIGCTEHADVDDSGEVVRSPECDNCYARTFGKRLGVGWGDMDADGNQVERRLFTSDAHWNKLRAWDRAAAAAGRRDGVFVESLGDILERRPELDAQRRRLWAAIPECPNLDFLLLTKRPENAWTMLPWMVDGDGHLLPLHDLERRAPWPNVWFGVTTGTAYWAARRLREALRVPAARHFASYEPALGPVNFRHLDADGGEPFDALVPDPDNDRFRLDWIVAGDESGHGRRAAEVAWFRAVRDQCDGTETAYHFKQWAGAPVEGIAGERSKGPGGKIHLPILDGRQHEGYPA